MEQTYNEDKKMTTETLNQVVDHLNNAIENLPTPEALADLSKAMYAVQLLQVKLMHVPVMEGQELKSNANPETVKASIAAVADEIKEAISDEGWFLDVEKFTQEAQAVLQNTEQLKETSDEEQKREIDNAIAAIKQQTKVDTGDLELIKQARNNMATMPVVQRLNTLFSQVGALVAERA